MANIYNSKYTRKQIEENIDQIKEDMKTLSGGDSGMSAKLSELETKVNNAGTSIGNLQKSVNDLNTNISNVEKDVKSINTSVTRAENTANNAYDIAAALSKDVNNNYAKNSSVEELKGKVGELYGKSGALIKLNPQSNGDYDLDPNYRYNYITNYVNHAVVKLTYTSMEQMEIGQEIYVFMAGNEPFYTNIAGNGYMINPDGERISFSYPHEITPECGFIEISIVKVESDILFVRMQ